ncbi:MFS transporter, SP family [Aphelenchoides besseyi]|nr:MFS transporter, SP family [Aphelenchoides besseyi]KAI6208918.1 MFS transporter, SP family [Aphelenchoides besseyi]
MTRRSWLENRYEKLPLIQRSVLLSSREPKERFSIVEMKKHNGRMFSPLYFLTVIVTTLGASTQFYNYGIVNPEQELLTEWINETYANRNHGVGLSETQLNLFWSFTVSSIAVGAIVGASLTRLAAEKAGRRNALILNGVVNVVASLMELTAKFFASPELLIVGRLVLGACMGLTTGLVPMYLMEITPSRYRGAAGTFHQVAVAFSDWFSLFMGLPEILGSKRLWPIAFGFSGLPALILVLILPFCPESPKYLLVSKGEREKSKLALNKLVSSDEAKTMFEQMIKEAALSQEGLGTYRELFTRRELRIPLIVSITVMFAQQFTGCSAVFAFSTDMFINAGVTSQSARFATLAVGIAYFLFACSAPFLIERLGRRKLSLFQLFFVTISLTILSAFTYLQSLTQSKFMAYGSIISLVTYMCVYGVGSPIAWMITSELFETKFRSAAVTLAVFISWSLSFVISTCYLPFQQLVGISFSFLPFIALSTVFTVLIYFLLPETQHKPTAEVIEEIRFRAASVSQGHPFRSVPQNISDETQSLISDSDYSYHRYMSITG